MSEYKCKPFTLLVSAEEVKGNEMKIEAGKYYKTRDGRKVGPMREIDRELTDYPWTDQIEEMPMQRYNDWGEEVGEPSSHDLISEWQDEAPSPIRTVTRRQIVPGVYGSLHVYNDGTYGVIDSNPDNIREAAHILNQIAEVLEENGK